MFLGWELFVGGLPVKTARVRVFPPGLDSMCSLGTELLFPEPVAFLLDRLPPKPRSLLLFPPSECLFPDHCMNKQLYLGLDSKIPFTERPLLTVPCETPHLLWPLESPASEKVLSSKALSLPDTYICLFAHPLSPPAEMELPDYEGRDFLWILFTRMSLNLE